MTLNGIRHRGKEKSGFMKERRKTGTLRLINTLNGTTRKKNRCNETLTGN